MIAVTFALSAESSGFVRSLRTLSLVSHEGVESIRGEIHGRAVAILHTGVGEKSCREKIEIFLRRQKFQYLISAGFAGALDEQLSVGDLILSENFSSPELLHSPRFKFVSDKIFTGNLVTSRAMIESKSDRARLAQENDAVAVDMETEFIAAACAGHQLPMLSVRAISDTVSAPFPAPGHVLFDLEKQRTNFLRLARYLVAHPRAIGRLNSFRRQVAVARKSLTEALETFLGHDLI
ncbi:MAG TPA: hypothetical protein VGI42_00755 [Chthoniobacterales bacterium]